MAKKYDYKKLEKHKLESTNLDWTAYDKDNQILYIAFLPKANNPGTVYAYDNVPEDIFEGLLNAGSHGRYFWVKIRNNKNYSYQRIK